MAKMWKLIRLWILCAWCFLTIGILLGSWWAYHELGWGGWWFWDPVENASLMPWLLATACIHSITKKKLNFWTLIFAQGTFILSILGTFFVRSGLLSSVHSFATDSTKGLFLLTFLLFITFISISNWILFWFNTNLTELLSALRTPLRNVYFEGYTVKLQSNVPKGRRPLSSETSTSRRCASRQFWDPTARARWCVSEQVLLNQNFYLCLLCLVVFFGTSAPLFFYWFWNRDINIGAPFYNGTNIPLFTSIFFAMLYIHFPPFNKTFVPIGTQLDPFLSKPVASVVATTSVTKETRSVSSETSMRSLLFGSNQLISQNFVLFSILFFIFFFTHCFFFYAIVDLNILSSIFATISFFLLSSIFWFNKKPTTKPITKHLLNFPNRYNFSLVNIENIQKRPLLGGRPGSPNFLENPQKQQWVDSTRTVRGRPQTGLRTVRSRGETGLRPEPSNAPEGKGLLTSNQKVTKYHSITSLSEMRIAHTGIVFFIIGILLSNNFKFQFTEQFQIGSRIRLDSQICCLRSIDHSFAPTFHSICANLVVYPQISDVSDKTVLCVYPEKRFYFSLQGASTTKVAIHSNLFTDLYCSIGTGNLETGWFTTIMKLPFIFCIWLGFTFGVIGSLLSLKKQLKKYRLQWL